MTSREKILSTVEANQPPQRELPPLPAGNSEVSECSAADGASGTGVPSAADGASGNSVPSAAGGVSGNSGPSAADGASGTGGASATGGDLSSQFIAVLESIGGAAYVVSGFARIATILHEQFGGAGRVISGCPELASFAGAVNGNGDPHMLEDVDLAILPAHFGVAENGACWITESQMLHRALPFITQHLALIIRRGDIVANMHQAYDRIAELDAAANPAGYRATSTSHTSATATSTVTSHTSAPATSPVTSHTSVPATSPVTSHTSATATTSHTPAPATSTAAFGNAAIPAPYGFATFIAGPSKTADIEQSLVLGAHGPMSLIVFLLDEQLSDAGFY